MSRSGTRLLIHQALKFIGSNGFDGVSSDTASISGAFQKLSILPKDLDLGRVHQVINELRRQSLIDVDKTTGRINIYLTVKGIHRLQQEEIESLTIKQPHEWDRKWRLVMFDIPTHRSESRYILTSNLKRLGFKMLQKSFWVHPYPCFDVTEKVIQYSGLQNHVSLAEISRLDSSSERRLKRHFTELI